ncbi:hypothetical protein [uncultured Acinetobacter sp.]|uniref:hypothetical protein n=1 Tax=uncultured Acinetobacter sp. TaxID=165433 RepID=UPI0037484AD6
MGQQILLQGANFVDEKYPILRADARITNGSLLLLDFSHSLTSIAGVPSDGTIIPNIAFETANQIIGSGDKNTLGCLFKNTLAAANGKLERTSKGALHGIISNTSRNQKTAGFEINSSTSALLWNYIKNNLSRNYAVFIWSYVTRVTPATSNLNDSLAFVNSGGAANNYLLPVSVQNSVGVKRSSLNAANGFTGSLNANNALNNGFPFYWGQTPPYQSLNPNTGKSMILYSYHLVDVAKSGKTFAELDAIDAALFNDFFSSGGRFYGDTWSDPASVLA